MAAVPIALHGLYDLALIVADRLPEADAAPLCCHAGACAAPNAGMAGGDHCLQGRKP